MKLVFNRAEMCEALGKSPAEFDGLRANLELLGFPKPVQGLGECWSIMEVIRWVNGDGSSMMAALLLSDEEDDPASPGNRRGH
jgi:hypothetical protein